MHEGRDRGERELDKGVRKCVWSVEWSPCLRLLQIARRVSASHLPLLAVCPLGSEGSNIWDGKAFSNCLL